MAKLTLADVTNILGNPTSAANTLNSNNTLIETALENTLSRDGATPNQMSADIDMNHNDLINIKDVHTDRLFLNNEELIPGDLSSAQIATQPEAEGGLENSKIMTPLRVKQAVDAYGLLQTDIGTTAGTVASGADFRFRIPSVRAFGALLDGVTDDSAAIQASLTALGEAYIPWTITGFVAGNITLGTNQKITGEKKTLWTIPASASYGIRVTADGAGTYATVENFLFDGALCPTTTTAIRFGTSTGIVFGFRAKNVDFRFCGEAVGQETHASNYVVDLIFQDCYCYLTRGRQVYVKRSRGFITFREFKIDHTFNTGAQVTWEGARFEDMIGLELEKFDVVGPSLVTPVTYQPTSIGIVISGAGSGRASVWLTRVLVDNTRGPGIVITNVFNLFSVDTCSYQNLGGAIDISDVNEAVFSNTSIAGGKGVTGSPGGASGLIVQNSTRIKFSNTQIKDCDGHGSVINNCTRILFDNLSSTGNTGIGWLEVGTSNLNQVRGADYSSNTGGNFTQSGAASVHVEWISSAGALTARTLGAGSF